MKTPNPSQLSLRHHRSNREVSSRFLPSPPNSSSVDLAIPSPPRESLSPIPHKTKSSSSTTRHHQLWPSSSSSSSSSRNSGTLADRISEDRVREHLEHDTTTDKPTRKSSVLYQSKHNGYKENDRPIKLGYSPASPSASPSSSSHTKKTSSNIVHGRLSLDENALRRKPSRRNSVDPEPDYSDPCSRRQGIEVPSRYMSASKARSSRRRGNSDSDSNIVDLNSDSSLLKKLSLKNTIKRANSLGGYKSSKSQWALSPGRSGSPSMSLESLDKSLSFSSSKQQPASPPPTKAKGVEKFWSNMGFDLFKSSKNKSLLNSNSSSSPTGFVGNSEAVHQLRLLDNRLMQWRYANARAQALNESISHQAQSNVMCAWDGLGKLRHSVLKRKIQFEKQKLDMKLNFILYSQMKLLEAWGGMDRQHLSAITKTKESLHSVVCRVPLSEGAKVDIKSTFIAMRNASDLAASIKSMLTCFSHSVDEPAVMLSELAKVVSQEKQLLEEFYDLFQTISVFEFQERSAKCNLIQLEGWQWKYQQQQLPPLITS